MTCLRKSTWPLSRRALPALAAVLVVAYPTSQAWAQSPEPVATKAAAPNPAVAPKVAPVPSAGTPPWSALTASQKNSLAPLAKDWAGLDTAQRAKWLELAARFPTMSADEQQRVQQRMAEWSRLSPAERGRARLTFQEAKQLNAEEKQARWQAYQALPAQEREQLTARGQQVQRPQAPAPAKPTPLDVAQPKQNTVVKPPAHVPLVRPVAPTVVQNKPGATTTLMNKPPAPPRHQQPGEPKIAASPEQVNSSTLLPKVGPQQAALAASAPAAQ